MYDGAFTSLVNVGLLGAHGAHGSHGAHGPHGPHRVYNKLFCISIRIKHFALLS